MSNGNSGRSIHVRHTSILGDFNFIGITLSMASLIFQCIFSLPVSHSTGQAARFRTHSITLSFRNPFISPSAGRFFTRSTLSFSSSFLLLIRFALRAGPAGPF